VLFRALEADPKVSELLLLPRAADTQNKANGVAGGAPQCLEHQEEQRFRQISTAEELRELFLLSSVKAVLVERKRNSMASINRRQSALINRVLSLLDLDMTVYCNDVVPKETGATEKVYVERVKFTIPTSLRGVRFLSQAMHHWFIQAIGWVGVLVYVCVYDEIEGANCIFVSLLVHLEVTSFPLLSFLSISKRSGMMKQTSRKLAINILASSECSFVPSRRIQRFQSFCYFQHTHQTPATMWTDQQEKSLNI
jgi:hypothetical protein